MKMETVDGVSNNIDKIADIFSNCIVETSDSEGHKRLVNFDLLKQMLSSEIVEGNEAFEFTWVGKRESIIEANKPIRKTLLPLKEKSRNWNDSENVLYRR